jgi:sulfite exporter TauE/SafE
LGLRRACRTVFLVAFDLEHGLPIAAYLAMLAMGLAGGIHCAAMCGGFIASASRSDWQPVQWHRRIFGRRSALPAHPALWMNLGRLSTYVVLGAAFAGVASIGRLLPVWVPVQTALFVAANAVLILYGIGLIGREIGIRQIEAAGMRVHQWADGALGRLPLSGAARRYAVGIAWGFVPCGLVYSALAIAALTGEPIEGAMIMLSFGAGTLPAILGAQWVVTKLGGSLRRLSADAWQRIARCAMGIVLLGFGLIGLARAAGLDAPGRLLALCIPGYL